MLDVTSPPDADALVGRLAVQLGREGVAGLREGLAVLVHGAGLRSAALRRTGETTDLLAVAGDVVHAVSPLSRQRPPTVELPVCTPRGRGLATLTVTGARPGTLPVLRDAAAVLATALAAEPVEDATSGAALLCDAEVERDALADALHDGPVQDLVAARYAVDLALRTGDATQAREAVQSALVGLRHTLWRLRPRGADGLAGALHGLSTSLLDSGRPGLRLRIDPTADVLPQAAATAAYRLVQAVVDGAAQAGGPPVSVRLSRQDAPGHRQVAVLTVEGCHAPPPARWRRTAVALGGNLLSHPGRLRLTLPLPVAVPTAPATTTTTKAVL